MTATTPSGVGSTGATLSGSFSGASATPTAVGFKYGTTSGNLNQTLSATNSNGSFSAILSGLSANTKYYYQAFVTVSGTGDYASQSEDFYGDVCSFTTGATSTVTTGSASNITSSSATLSASYANIVTGTKAPQAVWFAYGTISGNLNQTAYYNDGITSASGSFSVNVSLSAGTTYYFKAYMTVWNGSTYVDISGNVQSFTTSAESAVSQGYLGCYEMPTVSASGTGTTGYYNTGSRDDQWYRYNTGTSTQKVITHTIKGSKQIRNYTVLFDSNKHAPLWAAFPMHANVYGGTTNRSDDWKSDPSGVSGQQTGLDNASTVGYSRGHFVASQYRKLNDASNLQTFYYTNQAPQYQNGFNSGVWSTLESRVLNQSPSTQSDTLYVVVGVLYEESYYSANPSFPRTLPSDGVDIPIPTHFYTCLMKCTFNSNGTISATKGIAFVYPNVSHTGENYYDDAYVTSIHVIEQRAGFDFFANVPGDTAGGLQYTAEDNTNHYWFTGQGTPNNISGVSGNNWGSF